MKTLKSICGIIKEYNRILITIIITNWYYSYGDVDGNSSKNDAWFDIPVTGFIYAIKEPSDEGLITPSYGNGDEVVMDRNDNIASIAMTQDSTQDF